MGEKPINSLSWNSKGGKQIGLINAATNRTVILIVKSHAVKSVAPRRIYSLTVMAGQAMGCQILFIVIATLLLSCNGQSDMAILRARAKRLPPLSVCGLATIETNGRITNGEPAELGEYPWMANLGYALAKNQSPRWLCAGSLITNRYVLTAAHCVHPDIIQKDRQYMLTTVRVGDLDLNSTVDDGASPVDYEVESYKYHEQYANGRKINDIALVRTKKEVVFTEFIKPICLPAAELQRTEFVGFTFTIAGWGKTNFTERFPLGTHLLKAEVQVQDRDSCRANITSQRQLSSATIDKRVFCASSPGHDACQGDSGGPLMLKRSLENQSDSSPDNMFVMGVVSYGYKCAEEGYPGVYTRVSEYIIWLLRNLDI